MSDANGALDDGSVLELNRVELVLRVRSMNYGETRDYVIVDVKPGIDGLITDEVWVNTLGPAFQGLGFARDTLLGLLRHADAQLGSKPEE